MSVGLRAPGPDARGPGPEPGDLGPDGVAGELRAVVGQDPIQPPASAGQIRRDPARQVRGMDVGGLPAADQRGPPGAPSSNRLRLSIGVHEREVTPGGQRFAKSAHSRWEDDPIRARGVVARPPVRGEDPKVREPAAMVSLSTYSPPICTTLVSYPTQTAPPFDMSISTTCRTPSA